MTVGIVDGSLGEMVGGEKTSRLRFDRRGSGRRIFKTYSNPTDTHEFLAEVECFSDDGRNSAPRW